MMPLWKNCVILFQKDKPKAEYMHGNIVKMKQEKKEKEQGYVTRSI